jgi:hypothetical protein
MKYLLIPATFVTVIIVGAVSYTAGVLSERVISYKIVDSSGKAGVETKGFVSGLSESNLIFSKNNSVYLFSTQLESVMKNFSPSHSKVAFYSKDNSVTVVSKLGDFSLVNQTYEEPSDSFHFVPEIRSALVKLNGSDYYLVHGLCLLDRKKYVVIIFPASSYNGQAGFCAACRLGR